MQDNVTQTAMQPYLKLVQGNLELLAKFATSPEVAAQAAATAQALMQRSQESAASLVQSSAFAQLAQGMLKNYTEFLTELGQSCMALFMQAPAAMAQQLQEASKQVVDAGTRR